MFYKFKINKDFVFNFASLSGLHYLSYVIPLITYPFLIAKLGYNVFGEYILQQTIISYGIILVNFSFELTGPISLAGCKTESQINHFLSKIFTVKLFLTIIGLVLLELFLFFSQLTDDWVYIYRVGYLSVIGTAFYSAWVFRGLNKNAGLLLLVTIVRVIYCLSLLFFIEGPGDLDIAVLLNSVSILSYGTLSFLMMYKYLKFKFKIFPIKHIIRTLRKEWYILLSNVFVNTYLTSNLFFLKFFGFANALGPFAFSQKIFEFTLNSATPVNQSLVSTLTEAYRSDKLAFYLSVKNKARLIFIMYLILSLLFFCGIAVYYFYFPLTEMVISVLTSLFLINLFTPFMPFGQFYTNVISILGYHSSLAKITLVIFLISISISFLFTKYYGLIGSSISLGVTIFVVFYINRIFLGRYRRAHFNNAS